MASQTLQLPEEISDSILARSELNMTAKRVCAQLAFMGAYKRPVCVYQSWLASRLQLTRQAINKALKRLEDLKLISGYWVGGQRSYKILFNPNRKKFFLLVNASNSGHCWSMSLVFTYLKFRQGKNCEAFPKLTTIAAELGMSKPTVITAIKEIEAVGAMRVIRVNGGLKQKNKYRLLAHLPVKVSYPAAESRVKKRDTKINTSLEVKTISTDFSKKSGLSKQAHRKRQLLTQYGVKLSVANDIAADDRVTVDTVQNAILNGLAKQDKAKLWRLQPGYIIAAINQANAEHHGVSESRGTTAVRASIATIKANQQASTKRLSDPAERSAWIENQKRLLEVA